MDETASVPTCENCIHTIKHNGRQAMLVCVPHLKTVLANNLMVCDLYSLKGKRV